uniref:Uncharacterized protein n=1 Tax=Anguilla anguilla TaxID=7936 RepID=A0A0E9SBU0_ANGAN
MMDVFLPQERLHNIFIEVNDVLDVPEGLFCCLG